MIHLTLVNEKNFSPVLDMRLPEAQNRFVAPNVVSMAQAWLYRDTARPFAVCDDETVVGFMMLDWDEGERNAGVWRFMIAPEHQRKGYGRAALTEAIRMVREAGCFDMMNLDYVPGNDAARALYASLGFRENGEVEDGEIVMTLPLTDAPQVGMLTADEDDTEELLAILDEAAALGRELPMPLRDWDAVMQAIAGGQVTRFTLMAESIGIGFGGALLMKSAFDGRREEALAALKKHASILA